MKELLERYGYTFTGNCNCDGHATEKYMKDEFSLRIRTKQTIFKIKRGGRTVHNWQSVKNLQQTLTNIHHEMAIQA